MRGHDASAELSWRDLHEGMDDTGIWANHHAANLRAGLFDARAYELAEQERNQKLRESAAHLLHTNEGFARVCRGYAFCQGSQACEDCPEADPAWLASCEGEMACTAGDEPEVRPAKWLGVAVILVLACIGAGAVYQHLWG